jgi:hypothetical protein
MQQNEEKASFRGLKPVESTQFTSALSTDLLKKKTFSAAC